MCDCLLLCVEEIDSNTNKLDTKQFVLYDTKSEQFFIYGKKSDTNIIYFHPYSFACKKLDRLIDFMLFTSCSSKRVITLYNYDNFPASVNEITYDGIIQDQYKAFTIVSYDYDKITRNEYKNILKMLKNVNNHY